MTIRCPVQVAKQLIAAFLAVIALYRLILPLFGVDTVMLKKLQSGGLPPEEV
jgi:hypothetical protein